MLTNDPLREFKEVIWRVWISQRIDSKKVLKDSLEIDYYD